MTFIFFKILIIFFLTFSVLNDIAVNATCQNTNNCGSDSGVSSVFPDLTTGDYNTAHGYHAAGMDIT